MKSFSETNKAKKAKGGQEAAAKKEAEQLQRGGTWKPSSGEDEDGNEEAKNAVMNAARQALKDRFTRKPSVKTPSAAT